MRHGRPWVEFLAKNSRLRCGNLEIHDDGAMVGNIKRVGGDIDFMPEQFDASVAKDVVKRIRKGVSLLRQRAAEDAILPFHGLVVPCSAVAHDLHGGLLRV